MVRTSVNGTSVAASAAIPLNVNATFPTAVQVAGTFVATYSVEYTLDDVLNGETATWTAVPSGSALSAAVNLKIDFPVCALRLNVTAYTSGTVAMKILQGDAPI